MSNSLLFQLQVYVFVLVQIIQSKRRIHFFSYLSHISVFQLIIFCINTSLYIPPHISVYIFTFVFYTYVHALCMSIDINFLHLQTIVQVSPILSLMWPHD